MNIITLTKENLEEEHICCAIASRTSNQGIAAKKEWLNCRIEEGLKFKKLDARGKVFIEYIPAENAWIPIKADGYILINCFWVSGSFKGKGHGKTLLEECEKDAKKQNKNGVVVVVGNKKKPFLSDKSFFTKYGYEVCDTASPYFELLVKRFNPRAETPQFNETAKNDMPEGIKGIDIFYTAQCPFTVPYIELLNPTISASEITVRTHQIKSKKEAQAHFCPVTTYSVFIDGKFETNEILTPVKLEKLIAKL